MPFSSNVARVISLSVVWGTLLATHLRRRRNETDNQSSTLALEGQCSQDQRSLHANSDMVTSTESPSEMWGGHETSSPLLPAERPQASSSWIATLCSLQYLLDPALLLLSDSTSMLRRVLSAIGSFVSPTPAEEQAVIVLVDRLFAESMNVIKGIALSLDLPTHMPESFYAKLPFRRSSSTNNTLKSLMEDFELLTFYCKSNEFLKAVAPANISLEFVQHSLDKLENVAIYLLATYFPVDELEEASARGGSCSDRLNLLLCLDVPATRDITPFPAFRPKKDHLIRFGYCQYQFASFLAYLSIIPESVETLSLPSLEFWLDLWTASQDIRLQLLSAKIKHNIQAQKQLNSTSQECSEDEVEESSETKKPRFYLSNDSSPVSLSAQTPSKRKNILNPPTIYGPDLYKLDKRDDGPDSPPPEVDLIFLNGMLGSVFHTWRQSDHCFTNGENGVQESTEDSSTSSLRLPASFPGQIGCWPQAWLSEEFPNARIIGINVNLKPFIWNPISPAEKTKRRIDQRARDILQQLLLAGVGRRPIIWVAHSAGGILTKELIKLSATWFSESPSNNVSNSSPTLLGAMRSAVSSIPSLLRSNTDYCNIGADGDGMTFEYQRMNITALLADCGVDMEPPESIAEQTKGIIFLSVPHRGNQSMMFLYHFPMVFTLTPEAKQLQQNSASIVSLHNWFLEWASRHPLQVLNMVEDRVTVVNRWYSVHLVLPEPQVCTSI
ncbi:unnamed protein product [Hymenolepis diminuta]|uniref:Protein SERAC1 n=1 Tax=Hymenolepis diminuta TaxID=6216 RepID=A0A564Y1K1_HYMDI|nr:unnamed protein product [Hymenolepis diminuta]